MLTLFDTPLSLNCYKIRLFLSLLKVDYVRLPVDLRKGEQKSEEMLSINPFGQVPVLKTDSLALRDSTAILVWIARTYGDERWMPHDADDEAVVMLSCILPTGMECGVLNGQVKPGDIVAIVGDGPVGLATLLMAQLYSPAEIFMIGRNETRLAAAHAFGATKIVNSSDGKAVEQIMTLTHGAGVDVAIEAVGIPATFDICQAIIAPGGRIANVGVHGKPVALHLEKLWATNITLTTRLVDAITTPMLLRMVQSGRLDAKKLVSHRFKLSEITKAYDTFANAQQERALKVVLQNEGVGR